MPVSISSQQVGGHQLLELEGEIAGRVLAYGGGAVAEVVSEPPAESGWVQKHVASIHYEDILIGCGASMAPTFSDWIVQTFKGNPLRKSGAIIRVDYEGREQGRMQFFDALINEVVLPELDASAKAPAEISLRLAPKTTQVLPGSGTVVGTKKVLKSEKQRQASNFRLEIIGLDCMRVNHIAPLAIKVVPGESRIAVSGTDSESKTVRIEAGNLIITMPESYANSFRYWHEDFVVMGRNGLDNEKTGSIKFLAPNLTDTLFALSLEGLGIVSLTRIAPGEAGVQMVRVEMYCKRIVLDQRVLATASTPQSLMRVMSI